MQYAISLSALVAIAFSATHEITVGPGLNYQPDSLTASSGDIVAFKFSSVEHDVVSGSFDSPCQPDGNIYSGDGSDGDVFSVTINGTDPIWIYCSVPGHCQGGMAMLINGNSDHTLDDYKSAASSGAGSSQPDAIAGGVYGDVSSASGAASSTGSSSSQTASGTATSSGSMPTATSSGSSNSASSSSSAATASATSSTNAASMTMASGFVAVAALISFVALL